MKRLTVAERTPQMIEYLCTIWRASVTATHDFLTPAEIDRLAAYVPGALKEIPVLITAGDNEDKPDAFMGIAGNKLEMLFIAPAARGKGLGRQLLTYGIDELGVTELCVNEDNPQAKGFYEHLGFVVYKRTERDEQGGLYPLLYMSLEGSTS